MEATTVLNLVLSVFALIGGSILFGLLLANPPFRRR